MQSNQTARGFNRLVRLAVVKLRHTARVAVKVLVALDKRVGGGGAHVTQKRGQKCPRSLLRVVLNGLEYALPFLRQAREEEPVARSSWSV